MAMSFTSSANPRKALMEKVKKRVYFFESNIPMNKTIYLPFVSGLLQVYAQTFEVIRENYEFAPFIFLRDTPENLLKFYDNPSVAAFSVSIWNHQLSLTVARLVKEKFPKCEIIFGGPQVEKDDQIKYPFIDHIVLEEGERKFVSLLAGFVGRTLPVGTSTLNDYPSPYTKGLYEQTLKDYPGWDFQAIVETNRGCPFACSFCYWGQGFEEKKVRHHTLEHVRQEARWIAQNNIKYVFMADANFGMYERDQEVAKIYAQVKAEYGFPEKVRVCYGKNKEENVFKTAAILSKADLAKAVTLARQSNDPQVLVHIRRSNIKLGVYSSLQERYHRANIPTYTEIILGLPGETKESFKRGVGEILGSPTQLFIYHCCILPNTEMAEGDYLQRHGIRTVRVPLAEIHAEVRGEGLVTEYEDIVIETNTMSQAEWMECAVFAWESQLKQSFDVSRIPTEETARFYQIAENITNGYARGQVDLRFGAVYYEPEEMAFLRISLKEGAIAGDLEAFAREQVLYGRKSKVHQPPLGV